MADPSTADCPNCEASLVLLPSTLFPDMDERAAEQLDLGAITDTTTKEIVARYALVFPDGHYLCPACGERQGL